VTGDRYAAQIAWRYAESEAATARAEPQTLNFGYRVRTVRGARPAWAPVRVFDDGRRTWIEFPAGVEAGDLPPLFVITPEGAELVNYRVEGARYVVDRVFDAAELRLGARAPIVVRIERGASEESRGPRRARRRP
jgi:type IV secretion system protein VirB9